MNEFLFDMPPEPRPPGQAKALSHRHDPSTSYEAAEYLNLSGKLGAHTEDMTIPLSASDMQDLQSQQEQDAKDLNHGPL